ncbi:MAG: glycosyltransferase family 4 protein [Nanoarchaeota archaeon]|nr:glycosyltransferase family 4 protein [Nanoarchaeota archaeon]
MKNNKSSVLFVSTYPPRQCGIATFTRDLKTAMDRKFNSKFKSKVVAMVNSESGKLKYSNEVILKINRVDTQDYIDAAKKINKMDSVKLVNIQHEFGLYGGKYFNYLTAFLDKINRPVCITLHSVPPNPKDNIKSIIQYLAMKSSSFIVMVDKAVEILSKDYGINNKKIVVIPHGIHEVPYERSVVQKAKLGYKDKLLISSFGLISKFKNYEVIIKALPKVVKKYPNLLYLIMGRTHPGIAEIDGEKYRNSLKKLISRLNLEGNVKFINKYLDLNELHQYLRATDIFVSSGTGLGQIVSGTLSYAMGCGRPVITIPFLHAKEVVTKDRGILVELGNPKSYKEAIIKLLSNPELREKMGKNAYKYTRQMTWPNVAESYMKVFNEYM